jgi:hypothetical protein
MVTSAYRQTAQILQFPNGGRAGLMAKSLRFADDAVTAMPTIIDYGSWYHDEAIRADEDNKSKPHA